MAKMTYIEYKENMLENYLPEEVSEIERVHGITVKYFRKILLCILAGNSKGAVALLDKSGVDIFDEPGVEFTVTGEENVSTEEGAIYACNHATHSTEYNLLPENPIYNYAPPHYMIEVARKVAGLSGKKSQVLFSADNRAMNYLVRGIGHIPVPRVNRSMTEENKEKLNAEVGATLEAGNNVLICPEGKFWGEKENNDKSVVGPFKKGFSHFAEDNDAVVVPVVSKGFCRAGNKKYSVEFKEQMKIGVDETVGEFADRVRQVFIDNGFESVGD